MHIITISRFHRQVVNGASYLVYELGCACLVVNIVIHNKHHVVRYYFTLHGFKSHYEGNLTITVLYTYLSVDLLSRQWAAQAATSEAINIVTLGCMIII